MTKNKRKSIALQPHKENGNTVLAKIIQEHKDSTRVEIQKWRQALEATQDPKEPVMYLLQDIYDNLESDGHLMSQVELRKSALLNSPFSIIDKKTGIADVIKTESFITEWFYTFLENALDSIFKGFSLFEIVDSQNMSIELIPRRNVIGKQSKIVLDTTSNKFISFAKGFETTLIHVGRPTNLGLLANLCGQLIWKRNAQQSWAEFTEKYGQPLITATTNKSNTKDLDSIQQMLATLGESARAVLPEGTTIDIKPFAGSDSYKVYDMQIERINGEISKPIVGGTMLTDNGSARSQSEVHERNLDDKISMRDKRMIEFIVNGQLVPLMAYWGHDINPETDKFVFDKSFELSLKEHWEIVSGMLNTYDIDEKWVAKTFSVPILTKKLPQATPTPEQKIQKTPNSLSANFQ